MIFVRDLFQFRNVHEPGEVIEVKHVLVLTVFAKERHVLAEIHVFEMVRNEASIAALDAFSEFLYNFLLVVHRLILWAVPTDERKGFAFPCR